MAEYTMGNRRYRAANLTPFLLSAMMLISGAAHAQDSPCNQGRAVWPEIDPRNPLAICLPEITLRYGLAGQCKPGRIEEYGRGIYALGDISGDGLADWIVARYKCDTFAGASPYTPQELLLYKGVRGAIPPSQNYERIGPTEIGSATTFLARGDWDDDGHIDIAVRIQVYGDTSAGSGGHYDISSLVVFWGNAAGSYSISDTTHLLCNGDRWLGIIPGIGSDLNNDGIDDIAVMAGSGFSDGHLVPNPRMLLFTGSSHKRWGQDGTPRTAVWVWWNAPSVSPRLLDQDRNGSEDIVFHTNDEAAFGGGVSILYGQAARMPDTAQVESIRFDSSAGRYALFADVTGDQVPDLLVGSGREDFVKVYVGFKGQRLLEQYGSGHDTAEAGAERWWGRPWATMQLPRRINRNWFGDDDRLFDLGDANLDGVGDVYAFSWPYLLEYNGGGRMDSLVDALVDIRPGAVIKTAVNLGDIDGSGFNTIAVSGSGIAYLRPTRDIPSTGRVRRLPPGTGKAAVETVPHEYSIIRNRPWLSFLPNDAPQLFGGSR